MDGYLFVVVCTCTYKPVHGECSRVAVGSDGLWLSDHTSNSRTLYTHGVNLGGDHGARYLTAGAPVPASHWSHAEGGRGEVRGGHVSGEDISTSRIMRPLFQITSTASILASFHSVCESWLIQDWKWS
jgi:hypothetical protein